MNCIRRIFYESRYDVVMQLTIFVVSQWILLEASCYDVVIYYYFAIWFSIMQYFNNIKQFACIAT